MAKCSTYINGKACDRVATLKVTVPRLDGIPEHHPLCDRCAKERQSREGYPWVIKKDTK